MLARASRPHNLPFCPTQRVLISRWTPARALPARQPYLSNLLLDEAYPSDTAILKPQSDVGESLRDRQLSFSILRPARPTQPRCRLTARPSDPLNFAFLSKPIRLGEPRSPDGRRREHSRPHLSFQVHARQGLPVRHSVSETTVGRRREPPSQTISLFQVLSSARLTRPTRRLLKHTVGRRREPPSQTILPFKSHTRQGLPVRHGQLLKPLSDVGESLPARQTHPFRSARTTISNPVERYVPGRFRQS